MTLTGGLFQEYDLELDSVRILQFLDGNPFATKNRGQVFSVQVFVERRVLVVIVGQKEAGVAHVTATTATEYEMGRIGAGGGI